MSTTSSLSFRRTAAASAQGQRAWQDLRGYLNLAAELCSGRAMRDLAQEMAATRPELAGALRRAARGNWS